MRKITLLGAALIAATSLLASCKGTADLTVKEAEILINHYNHTATSLDSSAFSVSVVYSDGSEALLDGSVVTVDDTEADVKMGEAFVEDQVKYGPYKLVYKSWSKESVYLWKATQVTTDKPVIISSTPQGEKEKLLGGKGTGEKVSVTYTIVEFGDFANEKAVTIPAEFSEEPASNGWYVGSDGKYYGKVETGADPDYYTVSPIRWRIITEDYDCTGNKKCSMLMAENILTGGIPYYYTASDEADCLRTIDGKTVYNSNYKYSVLRAYLNGINYLDNSMNSVSKYKYKGFLQSAFSQSVQNKLKTAVVKNDPDSSDDYSNINMALSDGSRRDGYDIDYSCEDTFDKVFVIGEKEITTYEFGFESGDITDSQSRKRNATPYAKTSGITDQYYWIRTPYYSSGKKVRTVQCGYPYPSDSVNSASYGIVPCVVIDFADFE